MKNDSEFSDWKRHMRAGNACFKRCQILTAISHYNEAKYQARLLIDESENKSGAIAALIASHHNLAEVYRQEGEPQLCEQALCAAICVVDELLANCDEDSPTYLAALHGKNTAYCALLQFQRNSETQQPPSRRQLSFPDHDKQTLN